MASETRTPEDIEVLLKRLLAVTGLAHERQAQLQHALDSRIVIEQAKGIVAERRGIGVDAAFELLRVAARSQRIKLHELATAVVAGGADERVPAELRR
jgi:AmiR/NasT family two-component response regulator